MVKIGTDIDLIRSTPDGVFHLPVKEANLNEMDFTLGAGK